MTVEQVAQAYRSQLHAPMRQRQLSMLMSDVILLLCWCERTEQAEDVLQEVLAIPQEEAAYRHPYGNRQAFERAMRRAIENPEEVRAEVRVQIERLGVENLPVSELVC